MKRSTIHLFFAGIAVCLLLPALWQAYKVYNSQRIVNAINQVPESLTEYDPELTSTAHPGVLLEVASALSAGGEFEAAESLYVQLANQQQTTPLGYASQFNLANLYLREGLRKDIPGAQQRPLLGIAKQRYRDLLLVNPDDWDARVNLEIALRAAPELTDNGNSKGPPIKSVNVIVPDFTLKDLP